jgi:hypothetical protein
MALDGSVQGIGCLITEILLAIDGQLHQKIVGVRFAADVIRFLGTVLPDRRLKHLKVRALFIVGNLFSGTIGEVHFKGRLAEMDFKIFSALRSKLSHRQGRKQGKYFRNVESALF